MKTKCGYSRTEIIIGILALLMGGYALYKTIPLMFNF